MRLDKLNSFPVIAIAGLLLSALVGFALGAMGSGVSVVPSAPETRVQPAPAPDEAPLQRDEETEPQDDQAERTPPPRRDEPLSSVEENPDTPADPVRKTAEPRKLPEGRVDPVVEGARPDQPAAAVEITVSDTRGRRLPAGKFTLDVQSGPLGWHNVPVQAKPVPGERGVFRFHSLYPGEYRVRSLNANYEEVEKTVRLTRNDDVQYVSMTLQPLGVGQVEFAVRLEDGNIPEIIELSMRKGNQEDTSTRGRFGRHRMEVGALSGAGSIIAPTRMRHRPDGNGIVKLTLNTGITTEIVFTHRNEAGAWRASMKVDPPPGLSRQNVTLQPTEQDDATNPFGPVSYERSRLELTLTLNGESGEFNNVTLRRAPDDFTYRNATSSDGETHVFEKVQVGTWYVVAESSDVHAPFVQAVEVGRTEAQAFDVKTGRLRVVANREAVSPDPEGEMRYRVRLRPMGSGTIERAYNGNLTGKDRDHIDLIIPAGKYAVRVDSPENYASLAVMPVEQDVTMTGGAEVEREYTLAAGTSLRFVAVDEQGGPVPNVEFLVSFHPAGEVPEEEKEAVRKGGYDGVCETSESPFGPVYVHVWTKSDDWNNPDHVFQLALPAYGTKDLGAVVVK